jgi:NAD kinase
MSLFAGDGARGQSYRLPAARGRLFYDPDRPDSARTAAALAAYDRPDPKVILVVGGDGTMLRAIRQHWADGLPFFGINTGHVGFLLNDPDGHDLWAADLRPYRLPLLSVEAVAPDGTRRDEVAFNDCWVEREGGQTAWIEVGVNGAVRLPRLVADGILVATAAGSTGYARALGAVPLPFNAPLLTLAGSNVFSPRNWRPALLTPDCSVTVRNLDPGKRPLRGFVDGVAVGPVAAMTVRVSPVAAATLLFTPEHDPEAKLAQLQFPQADG